MSDRSFDVLMAGAGAIGSRFAAALDPTVDLTIVDNQVVAPENVDVAAFSTADVGQWKADVVAAVHRGRGGVGRALTGDVAYVVTAGLARAVDAVVLALDNPRAIWDACQAIWGADVTAPVLAVTCGGSAEGGGYQVRLFTPPGTCAVCLFGDGDRRADRLAGATSCTDTTAPRASALAAEQAAHAAGRILTRWRRGETALANARTQHDANGPGEFVLRMPARPSPRCPVSHQVAGERVDLGGTIATLTVETLAEQATACVGSDADILLGRRALPLGGLFCTRCGTSAPAQPLLLPAAVLAGCPRGCSPRFVRPLGRRQTITARELLAPEVAGLTLAAFGAGHGDEFVALGDDATVRLSCRFDWGDLDDRA